VNLHDDSEVRVEAASRLSARPGALLRTRGAATIRTGYRGSTQLLTKVDGTWKVTGSSGHWIE
jgi:hypothetical protein